MTPILVVLTIAGYFGALFLISYFASRKVDNRSFFQGTRKTPWYVVAFATIGSAISGVTFISVPGWVGTTNFAYLQMAMGFVAGQIIVAYILIPLFYKMNLVSIYEYLQNRFGMLTYQTGAWFFFVSKMLGAAVRLFLVCAVLQLLVFAPLGLPFVLNVTVTVFAVWLYTFKGGVSTLIWTDLFKTFCLVSTVVLCILFISLDLNLSFGGIVETVSNSKLSRMFFFDEINDKRFFFKQFFAGMFTLIATTGLDQDMMQRNLSCKNFKDSQKNMITSGISQFFVIALFLILGVLLYTFAEQNSITIPEKTDQLFPIIATQSGLPIIVGILFVIGLIAAAYSAAGSALTALTTSFTVDILKVSNKDEATVTRTRKKVHIGMSIAMVLMILVFNIFSNSSVIDAVYVLASYTYGPILGMFAFGIFMKKKVYDKFVPLVAVLSPILCFVLQSNSEKWFGGYAFSYELLIMNALFTFIGLLLLIRKD